VIGWIERARASLAGRWLRRGEHHRVGTRGEFLAERHLRRQGYRILGRNLVTPVGEVDLLAELAEPATIVLVEVKTRREGDRSLPGEASVGAAKRRRLARIAEHLVRANGWEDRLVRIDVIAIDLPSARGRAGLRHIVGVG